MKILDYQEVKQIKAKKAFQEMIGKICDCYIKGMTDCGENRGYQNLYKTKAQLVAYDLGWNRVAVTT